jgi:hypothetical protein
MNRTVIRIMSQTPIRIVSQTPIRIVIQTLIRMVDSSGFQTRSPYPLDPPLIDQKNTLCCPRATYRCRTRRLTCAIPRFLVLVVRYELRGKNGVMLPQGNI